MGHALRNEMILFSFALSPECGEVVVSKFADHVIHMPDSKISQFDCSNVRHVLEEISHQPIGDEGHAVEVVNLRVKAHKG